MLIYKIVFLFSLLELDENGVFKADDIIFHHVFLNMVFLDQERWQDNVCWNIKVYFVALQQWPERGLVSWPTVGAFSEMSHWFCNIPHSVSPCCSLRMSVSRSLAPPHFLWLGTAQGKDSALRALVSVGSRHCLGPSFLLLLRWQLPTAQLLVAFTLSGRM